MGQTFIDLTVVSARDLKSVSVFGKDQPLAVAWVDPSAKRKTKVAVNGGSTPFWNERLSVPLIVDRKDLVLTIEIYSKGAISDKIIGTVHIPVAEIPKEGTVGANKTLTYQVLRPSKKGHGSLSVIAKLAGQNNKPEAQSQDPNHGVYPPPPSQDQNQSSYPPPQSNNSCPPLPYNSIYPPVEEDYAATNLYPPAQSLYPPTHNSNPAMEPVNAYPAYGSASYPATPQAYPPLDHSHFEYPLPNPYSYPGPQYQYPDTQYPPSQYPSYPPQYPPQYPPNPYQTHPQSYYPPPVHTFW